MSFFVSRGISFLSSATATAATPKVARPSRSRKSTNDNKDAAVVTQTKSKKRKTVDADPNETTFAEGTPPTRFKLKRVRRNVEETESPVTPSKIAEHARRRSAVPKEPDAGPTTVPVQNTSGLEGAGTGQGSREADRIQPTSDRAVGGFEGPTWGDIRKLQGDWEDRFKAVEERSKATQEESRITEEQLNATEGRLKAVEVAFEGERQKTTGLRTVVAALQRQNGDLQIQLDALSNIRPL